MLQHILATVYPSTYYLKSHNHLKLTLNCVFYKSSNSLSILGGLPKTGDKNIALVLSVIFSSIRFKSKFKVSNSISIKTGTHFYLNNRSYCRWETNRRNYDFVTIFPSKIFFHSFQHQKVSRTTTINHHRTFCIYYF